MDGAVVANILDRRAQLRRDRGLGLEHVQQLGLVDPEGVGPVNLGERRAHLEVVPRSGATGLKPR